MLVLLFMISLLYSSSIAEEHLILTFDDEHPSRQLSPGTETFSGNTVPVVRHGQLMPVDYHAPPGARIRVDGANDLNLRSLHFVATVGFGTPPKSQVLIVDTGSDITWIRCSCNGCNNAPENTFIPSNSNTSLLVPCGSSKCIEAGGSCMGPNYCSYSVVYADRSSSHGILYHDTLRLSSSFKVYNFAFGCDEDVENSMSFGGANGVLGLGRGAMSLLQQSSPYADEGFSYCLPSPKGNMGFLSIGSTGALSSNVQFTTMYQDGVNPSRYYVDLVAIYFKGNKLPVPETVFTSVGTIIDSGSVLSYLTQEIFGHISMLFREEMEKRHYPAAENIVALPNCYEFTNVRGTIYIPTISLGFAGGARFNLSQHGIIYELPGTNRRIACMAFLPTDGPSVIGSMQQLSAEIVFDTARDRFGFGPVGSC